MSHSVAIQTSALTKSFGSVDAVRELDLEVGENSIFGFLGPNGAGKSTTIRLLLGLLRPSAGSGQIFGLDIQEQSTAIRRQVGYLAQEPRFIEYMTARETLRFSLEFFFRGPNARLESRIDETLELVGLQDKADRPIRGFSGGERQRLGIAQAQIHHPKLLILDEPAAALDPRGRHDVLQIMERLREHATIFFSTHILDDVQKISDTVAILNQGELIAQAPIEELLAGSGGAVYTLLTEGSADHLGRLLDGLDWVDAVQRQSRDDAVRWSIVVTDEEAARTQLLRQVLSLESIIVVEFGRKRYELEEVFLEVVEANSDGSE